jgi:serine/threonine-protein kinase
MAGHTRSKSEWALGLLIVAAFFLASGSRVLAPLEGYVLALGERFLVPAVASDSVAVVALDPAIPAEQWSAVVERLADARVVGLVPPFPAALRDGTGPTLPETLVQGVFPRRVSALPVMSSPEALPAWPARSQPESGVFQNIPSLLTGQPFTPHRIALERLPAARQPLAVLEFEPGPYPVFRAPLVIRAGDAWTASFALRLATLASGVALGPEALQDHAILAVEGPIATDGAYRVYPRHASPEVPIVTMAELARGGFDPKGKVVLLGVTDTAQVEPVVFTGGDMLPPVMAEARLTAAVLDRSLFSVPPWSAWAQWGALLAVGLVVAAVLPRLAPSTAVVLVLLLVFVALTVETGFISLRTTFVPLATPALALATGAFALLIKRRLGAHARVLAAELATANRLLGQSYHSQGQLDGALERYRRCPADDDLLERLYTLGLDFERRRQFGKAAAVFEHLLGLAPKFRDAGERLQRNREADGRMLYGKTGGTTPTGTVILSSTGLTRPILGRYEVERELGRGAMGAVYLGRDPKIGRTVAIKTMALSQEFDGEQLNAVRERFFREAETAGRLTHPNIVTIYDVGEEQDLAYIAMDYLKGDNLATFCRPDNLLPFAEAMAIAIQVAEALDYAHSRNVVHRDIKPANIVYDREEGTVKVTDFGVACLTDASKTRTGTVLGSPSYMSPEQVAGRRVDGRADLFSLGVTLFQLLTGELPFTGDSLASLMYQIANEKPADIRKLRKDLPTCIGRIIGKALQKDPERRYQSGADMAVALARCRETPREVS